jgi:intracellular sulfur oxidation DsrE/DsrF family protein
VSSGQVILVSGEYLGRGDQRLGGALANQFFRALARREADLPSAIIFMNAGVRLLIEGSAVLASLQELENRGVNIVACRTSVQHFDLQEKLEVGDSVPMAELVDHLLGAAVVAL